MAIPDGRATTMALISMGSALYVIFGAYGFDRDGDPTRVVAQIVTGVGFLGAGVIMKQGSSVVGLENHAERLPVPPGGADGQAAL